jgi:hypothetical protein
MERLADVMRGDRDLLVKAILMETIVGQSGMGDLRKGIEDLSEMEMMATLMIAMAEEERIESRMERLEELLEDGDWSGVERELERGSKAGVLPANFRGWAVISEALFSDAPDRIPSSLILKVLKSVQTVAPTRVAFDILLSRDEWELVQEALVHAGKHYTRRCRDTLCNALLTHGRVEGAPTSIIMDVLKTASTIETTARAFELLLKRDEWATAIVALNYSRDNYNDACNNELSSAVMNAAFESSDMPEAILASAFKSAVKADVALKLMGIILDRDDSDWVVNQLRSYSARNHKVEFQKRLNHFIDNRSKEAKRVETKVKSDPDAAIETLTFPSEYIYR